MWSVQLFLRQFSLNDMTHIKKLLLNFFLSLSAVALLLFFIEVYFNIFNPQELKTTLLTPLLYADNQLHAGAAPNKKYIHKTREYNVTYSTNTGGFRGDDYTYTKRE